MRFLRQITCGFALIGLIWCAGPALLRAEDTTDKKANAYIPRQGMSVDDLQAYIERLQESPASIRNRPGFAEGMVAAADRILESNPTGTLRTLAITTQLDSLRQWAVLEENADADRRLAELAEKYAHDEDKKVATAGAFCALEQRVCHADSIEPADLPKLLDEVKTALTDRELGASDTRLASAAVKQVNRLADDTDARHRLKEFGDLFSVSADPQLARYGISLIKASREGATPQGDSDEQKTAWVGKPMELAGTTADGAKFDISDYKGKIVLVDFWATWCGPCRASLPDLKETYEKFHSRGFEVVGVDLDKDFDALAQFLGEEKLPWVNVVGEDNDGTMSFPIATRYEIHAIPTTFLVGKDGMIVAVDLHGEDLAKQIEKLVDEK